LFAAFVSPRNSCSFFNFLYYYFFSVAFGWSYLRSDVLIGVLRLAVEGKLVF
jgi:hypothetical protein